MACSHLLKQHISFTCSLHLPVQSLDNINFFWKTCLCLYVYSHFFACQHRNINILGYIRFLFCSWLTDISTGLLHLSKPPKINWSENEDVFWTQQSDADLRKCKSFMNSSKNLTHKMRLKLNMLAECKLSLYLACKAYIYICFSGTDVKEWGNWACLLDCELVLQLNILRKKTTHILCFKVHSSDMEILEVIKFHNVIFTVTFYSKIILSNVHTWQHTAHFQIGACEECIQILLHVNRIDLGDILNISTTVASWMLRWNKEKCQRHLVHRYWRVKMEQKKKPELLFSELSSLKLEEIFYLLSFIIY